MRFFIVLFFISSQVAAQAWLQVRDFPGAKRDDGIAATLNNKIYIGTGLQEGFWLPPDFYVMDPANDTYSTLASTPAGYERQYGCSFTGNNEVFIFGGTNSDPLNTLIKYNISSNTWSLAASKPGAGLSAATCLQFGDNVIITGGRVDNNETVSNEVWLYSINNNSWTKKNDFPFGGRWRAAGTVLNGKGYLLFGRDNNGSWRKEMYRYDLPSDTWTKVMDLPQAQSRWYSTVQAADNKLVLFGGYDTLNNYYNETWIYFDSENRWEKSIDMPSFGRKGGMSCAVGNNIFYFCGINKNNERQNQAWVFGVPLGVNEQVSNGSLHIYPNPTSDLLFCSAITNEVEITDALGKKHIVPFEKSGSGSSIDVRALPDGCFLLKIKTDSETHLKKFIKVH